MIKFKISNMFQQFIPDESSDYRNTYYGLKPYDEDKFKDGKIVYFNSLKEVEAFRKEAHDTIDYTPEKYDTFSNYDWQVIDIELSIDDSEDNLMLLCINAHDEWRD